MRCRHLVDSALCGFVILSCAAFALAAMLFTGALVVRLVEELAQ